MTRFSTNANESVAAPNAVSEDDFDDFTERLARDVVRSASGHQSPTPAQLVNPRSTDCVGIVSMLLLFVFVRSNWIR